MDLSPRPGLTIFLVLPDGPWQLLENLRFSFIMRIANDQVFLAKLAEFPSPAARSKAWLPPLS